MSKSHFLLLLSGCVLFALIYSPAPLYFLSDDWDSLLFSLQPANIFHSFRPLSDASLYADYSVWKLNAVGFHCTNLLLHFACVFCFYFFSKTMLALFNNDGVESRSALLSSLLFLFYPFHSEALFWIVGRGAILCTLFGLLSLIFFIKKDENRFYYWLSLLFFIASLLSYEEAWVIPVLISVLSFFLKTKSRQKFILQALGFWLVFIAYLGGRFYFTQDVIGTPYGSERMMHFDVLFLCKNFAALVFRSVVPPMSSSLLFSLTCSIVALLLGGLLFINRKKTTLATYIIAVFFLLSLIPVLPLGIDTHDTESERFLYFPSAFFLLFFTHLKNLISPKQFWLPIILIIVEGIFLWVSYESFVKSSLVCRTTLSALSQIKKTDTLFCSQLPEQYKGAFIFRNGFGSAVKLLKKDSIQQVVILSRSELFHPDKNYGFVIKVSLMQSKKNVYFEWTENKVFITR